MVVLSAFEKMLDPLSFSVILALLGLYAIFVWSRFPSSKRKPLPPGPRPWPIIGNILQVGKLPHISMARLSRIYGPLMSLRLGSRVVVVASSPSAASEILKTHDRLLAARFTPNAAFIDNIDLERMALLFAPKCNDDWRALRALCRTELFSAKAIESQARLREGKLREMVEYVRKREGKVVDVGEVVFITAMNTISNLIFSNDLVDLNDSDKVGRLKSVMIKAVEVAAAPNIADMYPILAGLDPQGLRKKNAECFKKIFGFWEVLVNERRESFVNGDSKRDALDAFLRNGFDDHHINWLTSELIIAGSDTTTVTVEWAMIELLKNKEAMKNVLLELKRVINSNSSWDESQISQLPYLNACVKETLRLHPPLPLLGLRQASETCEVMDYTIPKDSQVFVNVWKIGRDPSIWENPSSFQPDRFLDSNMDYNGKHYEFLPFGSGRRICAGLPMANMQVHMLLAYLLYYFEWSLPDGGNPLKWDVTEKFGLLVRKEKPLFLVPNKKP